MIGAAPAFTITESTDPALPLLVAVPHAGRTYPASLMARARLSRAALEGLEDRHADLLIDGLVAGGAAAVVATLARAAIDLNRDPREIDPAMIEGPLPWAVIASPRIRAGLGLIPCRLPREGDLWRHRICADDVSAVVEHAHRPFHAAIADRLDGLVARHGRALLIDCHSMPPLAGRTPAQVVIGTLGGQACAPELGDAARRLIEADGLTVAIDQPYAGGYTLDRHGRPAHGRHAIQIEIDRTLYLLPDMRTADPAGVARIARLLAALGRSLLAAMPGNAASEGFAAAAE